MGIDLPKILAILPMGVIRRASSKTALILLNDDSNQSHQINLDEHNEYTFSREAFCFNKPSQRAFFDGTQKVLEYVYDGQSLSIQVFTTSQTNLFIDVNLDKCDIRAVGPLCIQGNFSILNRYDIAAKALSLDGGLICKDNISLNVSEDLSIFGEFNAFNLRIRAGVYYQSAKMVVEQLDLVAQVFCQTDEAVFKAASMRMIADISRISGQFEISDHCFSAVSHWVFGKGGSQSIIHFPAAHHVHVGALSIKDSTQVVIGVPSSDAKQSQWVVDDDIEIQVASSLVVYHGHIFCHKMDCTGMVEISDSSLSVKTLIDRGTVTLLRSQLNTKSIHLEMGVFSVQHSGVAARMIHAMTGHVLVQDGSALSVSDRFIADKATVKITDSDVSVKQQVVLQGCSKIRTSIIQTEHLSFADKVSIKKSRILAKVLQLHDTVCVEQSDFKAKDISLSGQLELDDVQIDTNSIEYQSSDARLRRNFVKAKRIVLEGGTRPEQFLFESSRLMAKSFTVLEAVDIQDSTMIGIDDVKANHSIQGHLFLRNSRWMTHSRVRSLVGSHIHPCEYSEIIAGKITASGDISVDESLVQCERLSLIGSTTILRSGEVIAENAVHIHRSELTVHTDSSLVAESMHLSGQSHVRLKKSNLHLSGQLTTSHDSKLDSKQTKIAAGKVRFLGEVELVKSLLSAEELIIYDDFSVQQSMVHAKEDIVLAGTAKARMGDSTLHARNIESFGSVSLESTQLHARETAVLWTGSKTMMTGASIVKANDVVIRGALVTQKKKQNKPKQNTDKLVIIARDYLDVSPASKISGDEDLIMSADIITQSGQIDLEASFNAKGRRFDNLGAFRAESAYLGFDDAVVNHGSISAKNIIIHSNLMNIFGRIYAEQSMSSSGFVSLNMGLIAANNYMNDSLVSMNLGVISPNVLADPRFIFSRNNLISTARTLAMMWAPTHASGIQLAFASYGFLMSSAGLYEKTKGFTRIFDLKRHEYMPILCQVKSLALLGQGLYTSGNSLYNQEYVNWQTSFSKMYSNPNDFGQDCWQTFQGTNWQEFGINSAEAFAGSYTDTSLIHANLGVSLGANTFKTNWVHVNLGQERSLFTHNIATNMLYNRSQSMGGKSSFTATYIQNQGTLSGTDQFYLRSKTVSNTSEGHIKGTHALIDIERLQQSGEFVAEEGRVHIDVFQDRAAASTRLKHIALEGTTLDSTGHLDLSRSHVREKEHFTTNSTSQFAADDVSIETGIFHTKGQLDYQHHLSIQADTAILSEGSVVNGQRADKDKLFVPSKDGSQSEFKPEHALVIEASKVDLGGQLSGGDYTQIQGRRVDTEHDEITKSEALVIRDTADIDLTHGSIKAKQAVISGKTVLDGFDIAVDAGTIEQGKGGLSIDNARYTGHSLQSNGVFQFDHTLLSLDELEQHGTLHGMHSSMKVGALIDDPLAKTGLQEVTLQGKRLDVTGGAELSRMYIQEDEYVHAPLSSKLVTDDVEIETKDFREEGALDYAHHLTIKAKKTAFAKGSVVNGLTTADEQLFAQHSENEPEAKPTLNPKHILIIEAPKVVLDASMSGGDYTEIHGEVSTDGKAVDQCEELLIGDSADIDLKHGRISTQSLQNQGKTSLDDFGIEAGVTDIGKDSMFIMSHSVFKGKALYEEGSFELHDSQAQIDAIDIHQDAHSELIDSYLVGHSVKDASHLSFGGDSGVIADDYQHSGYYVQLTQDGKSSTFSVKAKTANLQGGGDLDNAVFQIDHFANAAQFIAGFGAYSNYRFHQSLGLSTLDDLTLTNPITRNCDITVQATSIDSQFDYNKAHQLSFISTVGDITFSRALQGSNVYAYSARDILNRGQVLGADKVFFQAGRNIENRGKIASGKYTQILAKGNVTNLCEEEVYQGQWDTRRNYKAAVIGGGTGEDTDGIGLHIEADGEVISDVSDFVSQGSNYIQGKRGVHFNERHHVYIAYRDERHKVHQSNFLKKFKDVFASEYAWGYGSGTDIGVSHVYSGNGRNIICSNEGGVTSAAAQFVSPGGTDVYARSDIHLYSLRANNYTREFHTDWWKLDRSNRNEFYDFAQPTLFVDNGTTRIHSSEGNVDARGAYFIGGGDLEIKAKKQIFLGVDILDHQITERSQSFGWSMPGKGAWDTYRQGGKIWDIGAALDPSLGKANAVYQSKSGIERLASAANLGIDLANTGNSLMRGIAQSNITDELLARYGLGHDGQFAPSISLSLTQRKTTTRFQTQAQGGIDRGGNVTLEAGEGVDLENGVRVHAGRDLDINAPKIRAHGAMLQSSMQQTTVSETVGIVGLDGVESLGASLSKTKTSATSVVNAELSAGGNIRLHHNGGVIGVVELDGANIEAGSVDAKIGTLIIRDHQDTSQTQTNSVSLATNGMFSGYKGKGQSRVTHQHSGIHTIDGINTDGHEFVAHETHMIGGSIRTEGENHFKTDSLTTETLLDTEQYSGFGISGNLHDAGRLLGGKPSNKAGEPIFTTATVQIDRKDFVATQNPVIHGKQGTELSVQSLEGQLETQHDSGRVTQKDRSLHVQIDVPLTNHEFLTQASENVHDAGVKLSALLHSKFQKQESTTSTVPEPIVPVNEESASVVLLAHRRRRKKASDTSLDTEHIYETEGKVDVSDELFSINDTKVMHLTVTKAQEEYRTTGKLSDSTKHELKQQVTSATAKLAKAYGSAIFDEMGKSADSVKGNKHFRKFGLMWKLWMNEELTLLDDEIPGENKFKHGIAKTMVESGLDFALEFALKDMSGPMGIALTLLDISDSFYDKNAMKKRLKTGESHLSEVRTLYTAGDIMTGWALERVALDQIASARRMQAGHYISDLSNKAAKELVSCWDTTGKIELSKPKKFLKCLFSPAEEVSNDRKSSIPSISFDSF